MSIDAVIEAVERNDDGTADIVLGSRKTRDGDSCSGQSRMTVENPPPGFEACVGTKVWGGGETLMVGDTKWADRIGYTRLKLVPRR